MARVHAGKKWEEQHRAKPIDAVLVAKMLMLQHLYNFAEEGIESQVRDRLPFMHFLMVQLGDWYMTPKRLGCSGNDSKT